MSAANLMAKNALGLEYF